MPHTTKLLISKKTILVGITLALHQRQKTKKIFSGSHSDQRTSTMAINKYSDEELDHNEILLNGFLIGVYLLSLTVLLMSVSGSSFGNTIEAKKSDLLISTDTSKISGDTVDISNFLDIDVIEASAALLKHVNGKGAGIDASQTRQKVILWDEAGKTKKGQIVNPAYTGRHSITTTTKRY